MSDARSLLRAKRQEVRVNHPLASYTPSGQLRCLACGISIKQGTSWEGHIGSKPHRTSAVRLREEEQRRAQEEELQRQKRKASEEQSDEEGEVKRRRVEDNDDDDDGPPAASARGGFPADFFSDSSRAPPPPSEDEEDEDADAPGSGAPATTAAGAPAKSAIDEEWARFEAAVVNAPDAHETYERATIMAEPVLAPEVPEGFPPQAADGEDAVVVDEGELRRRKEQDDRELIMDRLLEEERAQEEADAKVTLLKSRLDAIRRQREARKAAKAKGGKT